MIDHTTLMYILAGIVGVVALFAGVNYFKAKEENPLTDVPLDEDTTGDELEEVEDWTDYNNQEPLDIPEETEQPEQTMTSTLVHDPSNPKLLINAAGDPNKTAILIGTNVCNPEIYQGDTLKLKGCVNDALNIRKLAVKFGYRQIYYLTDAEATIGNFLSTWNTVAAGLKDGDTLLVQRSGHGMSLDMNVLDKKGDKEFGGTNDDGTIYSGDQGAVLHDGVIVDDVYWRLLLGLPKVKVIWVNDSCHSATQYKLANSFKLGNAYRKPRSVSKDYLPTKDNVLDLGQLDRLVPTSTNTELKCTLISIAGCQEHEYSQDAYLDRKYQGAATACLMGIYAKIAAPTPNQLKELLPKALVARGFTQHPQVNIEGDQAAWDQPLL